MTGSPRRRRLRESSVAPGRAARRGLGALTLLLVLGTDPGSAALQVPPPPTARVNDYAGALSAADRERLDQALTRHEAGSSNQIVVAVFRSLEGESLEEYSVRLAQAWRIGREGLDNGVVFLVFLNDRRMRLEVGYGLEATLTDAIAASILRDVVAPRFREGRVADGLAAGIDAIAAGIAGTYQAPPRPRAAVAGRVAPRAAATLIFLAVVIAIVAIGAYQATRNLRGRRRGWTGGSGGWVPGAATGSGGWSGGFSSDSSGSSFSGGGGGFGGGGASGSW